MKTINIINRIGLLIILVGIAIVILQCSTKSVSKSGTGHIEGYITEKMTGKPLKNTILYLSGKDNCILSNQKGYYFFNNVDTGMSSFSVKRIGYNVVSKYFPLTIWVKDGETAEFNLELIKVAPKEDSITASREYIEGFENGRMLAEYEIENNNATLYTGGLGSYRKRLSNEGIPLLMVHGCIVDSKIEGLTAGHNDRIFEYIMENGFPEYPRWWKFQHFHDLASYYTDYIEKESPISLFNNEIGAISQDSVYSIWLRTLIARQYLVIKNNDKFKAIYIPQIPTDTVMLVWGPENMDIAIIRQGYKTFGLLDMKKGTYKNFERGWWPDFDSEGRVRNLPRKGKQ